MNNLIKLNTAVIGSDTVQTVNARELHAFLESKIRFSDWIKKRIADFSFVEGIDFTKHALSADTKMAESGNKIGGIDGAQKNVALESTGYGNFGQQGRIEYAITINMAKELAMVERNEKGKQARQYFIDCERRAHEPKPELNPANLSRLQLIEMAMQAEQERLVLETKVSELAPKAEALDRIATGSDGSFCLTDAAKVLQAAPRQFTTKLLELGWIHRRPMGSGWLAYQEHIKRGLLEHKTATGEKSDGSEWTSTQVRITAKGIAKLSEIFSQGGSLI